MKRKHIVWALAIAAAFTFSTDADAQSRGKKKAQKVVMTEEEMEHMARMEEMELATQKVVVVDSVVVDKKDMIAAIRLPQEAGRVTALQNVIGGSAEGIAYVTEFGDRCIFSSADSNGKTRLYHCDKLDGKWTSPQPLTFVSEEDLQDMDFPFFMADGTTLYFAAKGGEGIGGYDLYVTRYNAEDNNFYKPESVGMPFCSEQNDYFYIVDEYDNIGWFATDRRQPEGKVCIYTFIPTETREVYSEDVDADQLKSLARLSSIADTWGNGKERKDALQRIAALYARSSSSNDDDKSDIAFVVNDNTVYSSPLQFKAEGNRELFTELCSAKKELQRLCDSLEKSRSYYPKASDEERETLRVEILDSEQKAEQVETKINQLEKEIRNAENKEILR